MKLHYKNCGLENVWLLNGYKSHETKYGTGYSYEDIDGLYKAIAVAVCTSNLEITPEAFRFLRKRLKYSQEEIGKECGCTSQAVAKWEKGTSGIPVAASRLLRLVCLASFSPNISLRDAMDLRTNHATGRIELEYVDSKWLVVGAEIAAADKLDIFFEKFENGNQFSAAYVDDLMIRMAPEYGQPPFIVEATSTEFNQGYLESIGRV